MPSHRDTSHMRSHRMLGASLVMLLSGCFSPAITGPECKLVIVVQRDSTGRIDTTGVPVRVCCSIANPCRPQDRKP